MLRNLFTRRSQKSEACHELVAGIISRMPESPDLEARLAVLAETLAGLPGHSGAMMVAFDCEGQPFCYSSTGMSLRGDISPFRRLVQIRSALLEESYKDADWAEVPLGLVEAPGAAGAEVRFLRSADRPRSRGMILIAYEGKRKIGADPLLPASDQAFQFLEWTIRDTIRIEFMKLKADLYQLATEDFNREQLPIKADRVAEELMRIFKAEAVTLFVVQLDRLFLLATTDKELSSSTEIPDADHGLTGFALASRKSFRLRDATDLTEIKERTTREIKEPSNLESLARAGKSYRLMVVPMRVRRESEEYTEQSAKIAGAIRILRKQEGRPFTYEEQEALQQFADLLGAELDASWVLRFYGQIRRGESEAICISRNESRGGEAKEPIFVYVNPGAQILFDLTSDEIIGRQVQHLYSSEAEYKRVIQLLRNAREQGRTDFGPIEAKIRRPNGELRTVEISFRFVTPEVKPITNYTVAIIRDISKSHQLANQHKRLMALLDKQGLAYFLASTDGRTVNPTSTDSKLMGFSIEELKEKNREEFYIDPKQRKILIDKVHDADGQLVPTLQHLRRKDGTPFFAEGVIHLLKDDEDRTVGYEGLYEDVTDRIRLQGFLDADTDRVLHEKELLDKLRENITFNLDYTKSLNHQLGTPLAAILHTLMNLQEQLDARWERSLERAVAQARTWRRLIDNFGFMDKLLRGDEFPFRPINIARLAIETTDDFHSLLREKKLRIKVSEKGLDRFTINERLGGHEGLLRQAIVNLMDNAIKYSYPKTEIRIRGFEAGMQGRVLEISNKGIRVPKKERDNIFIRGYRTTEARDSTPDGFGMGLWLARKIIKAHGGTIRCDETDNERTVFRIYFPYKYLKRSANRGV